MFKVSIIIPNYNTSALTLKCLKHICQSFQNLNFEIIVVDNASEDDSVAEIQKNFPQVKIISNSENRGFARAINQGLKIAQGEYALLLNTDAFINPSLKKAIEYLDQNPLVATLSPRLIFKNGKINANFGNYPSLFAEFLEISLLYKILPFGKIILPNYFTYPKFFKTHQVKWLAGTCLFIRKSALEKIGNLDENFFMYFEDIDFGLRSVKAGFQNVFFAKAQIIHYHHASSKGSIKPWLYQRQSLLYFWRKHYPKQKITFRIINLISFLKLRIKSLLFL